jgi:hypothetical protein
MAHSKLAPTIFSSIIIIILLAICIYQSISCGLEGPAFFFSLASILVVFSITLIRYIRDSYSSQKKLITETTKLKMDKQETNLDENRMNSNRIIYVPSKKAAEILSSSKVNSSNSSNNKNLNMKRQYYHYHHKKPLN